MIIHESPSGSPVLIPDPVAPLTGAVRRQKARTTVIAGSQVITDAAAQPVQDGATPFVEELLTPEPMLMYEAQTEFDCTYYGADAGATQQLNFYIEASVNNGAWAPVAGAQVDLYAPNQENGPPANSGLSSRHCSLTLPPTLGSALGVGAGATSLRIRVSANVLQVPGTTQVQIRSLAGTVPTALGSGSLTLKLAELYA